MRLGWLDRNFLLMLVSYGNAYLAYRDQRTLDLAMANIAPEDMRREILFKRVNPQEFQREGSEFKRIGSSRGKVDDIAARTIEEWFQWLAREGFTRLHYVERHHQKENPDWHNPSSSMSDTANNCIQADGDGRRELWHADWHRGEGDAYYDGWIDMNGWATRHDNREPEDRSLVNVISLTLSMKRTQYPGTCLTT